MIHLQTPTNNWTEALPRLPDASMVKAVDNVQALAEVKAYNDKILTALRHWADSMQQFNGTYEEKKQRARNHFSAFVDETFANYAQHVDFVIEFNEYIAESHTEEEKQARIGQAQAMAEVWRDEFRTRPGHEHIRLALCSTAVGNDIPWQYAQLATEYDCILSYHAYTHWKDGVRSEGDWQYLSGRFDSMDADFRSRGYVVEWMFGESGPYESAATGWRHDSCLGHSVDAYVGAVREWINDVKGTTAYQEGRILGFNLFTTGGGSQWQWFETSQPELNILADMVKEEWSAVIPDPEPEPDPTLLRNRSFENGWTNVTGSIQEPIDWSLFWYGSETPNPYDSSGVAQFVPPEMVHKSRVELPQHEWGLFLLDGNWTLKLFKGHGSFFADMVQVIDLAAGRYRLTLHVFGDLVKEYIDGQKIWADDELGRDGLLQVMADDVIINDDEIDGYAKIIPGQWNEYDIEFDADGETAVTISFMCPFPLQNSGLFLDDWQLEAIEEAPPEVPPMTTIKSTVFAGMAGWSDKRITKVLYRWEHNVGGTNTFTDWAGELLLPEGLRLRGVQLRAYYEQDVREEPHNDVYRPIGTDVSHWQGNVNFNTMYNAGARWCYMKVSEGETFRDDRFSTYWQDARQTQLKLSGYHFWRAAADPVVQIDNFINTFEGVTGGKIADFPLVLDVEDTNVITSLSQFKRFTAPTFANERDERRWMRDRFIEIAASDPDAVRATQAEVDNLRACLQRIEELTGVKPTVYTGSWYWNPRFGDEDFSEYDYIEAEYTHDPDIPPGQLPTGLGTFRAHQYTSSGNGQQYGAASDNIDLNVFSGWLSEIGD